MASMFAIGLRSSRALSSFSSAELPMAWTVKTPLDSLRLLAEAGDQRLSAGPANTPSSSAAAAAFPALPSPAVGTTLRSVFPATAAALPTTPPIVPKLGYRDAVAKPRLAISFPGNGSQDPAGSLRGAAETSSDFAFLSDPETVRYLAQPGSKLLIILRGVSGSGKSTLVQRMVKELAPRGVMVNVASADAFFYQSDGTYKFDATQLQQAHEFSQKSCEGFCAAPESQVVVIDNTNIMHWEMTPYLRMAHLYRFVTLLAEPRTAGTPQECAARSKHGVTEALIAAKLKKLRNNFIFPLYYGFMVSAVDSGSLRLWAAKLARAMLQTDGMSDVADSEGDLLVNEFVGRTDADLVQWKERQDLLHCTAFYTGYGKRPGVREYEASELVQRNLGKLHQLEICGLLVTAGTVSFRLQLSEDQLKLWRQEEDSTVPRGSRAHLTVATAKGVEAVVSGIDTLKLAELAAVGSPESTTSIAMGKVLKYGDHFWYLALDKPKRVGSLFAGFYTRSRDPAPPPPPALGSPTRSPVSSPSRSSME